MKETAGNFVYIHLDEAIEKVLFTGNFNLNGVNYHIGNYDGNKDYKLELLLKIKE